MNNKLKKIFQQLLANWTRENEDLFVDALMKAANVNVDDEFNDNSDDAILLIHKITEEIQIVKQCQKQLIRCKNLSADEQIDIENTQDSHERKAIKLFQNFLNDYVLT
jgi:hypothetical protein